MKRLLFLSAFFVMSATNVSSCSELKNVPMDSVKAVSGINGFGFKVFDAIAGDDPVLISPYSLTEALAMTARGAVGETYDSMTATLGLGGFNSGNIGDFFKSIADSLHNADSTSKLVTANSIWADYSVRIKESFSKDSKLYYDAEVSNIGFDSPEAVSKINDWCSQHTEGKINEIVDELSPDLKVALMNALYFKRDWNFDFKDPVPGKFKTINGEDVDVRILGVTDYFNYVENETFQMLELPYGSGSIVMDVLLPKEGVDFRDAVKGLGHIRWNGIVSELESKRVMVQFPEFKMEFETELTDILAGLGMAAAFGSSADFSKMSDTPLAIGIVKQKTYIDVNQTGTEAAAVSFVGMKLTALRPDTSISFVANRPFVFAIRELSTNAILFLGQKTR